jgi:hypothetical protein
VAAPALAPARAEARPGQPLPPTERDDIGPDAGSIPGDDLLRASGETDVVATLDGLETKVRDEVAAAGVAQAAQLAAQGVVDAAHAAVEATETRIAELTDQSDAVVVEAFVDPPSLGPLDALTAETPADATVKQVLLDQWTDEDADLLTQLEQAQGELAARRAAEQDAVDAAQATEDEAAAALADVTAAQSGATSFVLAVQDRVARGLAEASALDALDPAAAEAVRQREAEIMAKLDEVVAARQAREAAEALRQAMEAAAAQAAADAARRPAAGTSPGRRTPTGASGGLGTASCPGGGSITVAASIAGELQSMLDDASGDGLAMCGGGYRDPAEQIAVRRANCGTSYYAIYEAPSSACSPPTAPPGTSMHEQGLAVDITCGGGTIGRTSACFRWLSANAAGYGFYNLPAEAWHWSTNGT